MSCLALNVQEINIPFCTVEIITRHLLVFWDVLGTAAPYFAVIFVSFESSTIYVVQWDAFAMHKYKHICKTQLKLVCKWDSVSGRSFQPTETQTSLTEVWEKICYSTIHIIWLTSAVWEVQCRYTVTQKIKSNDRNIQMQSMTYCSWMAELPCTVCMLHKIIAGRNEWKT